MTPKPHLPGTRAHAEALYKAMCAYQEGLSLEAAAATHRVNPETLRRHMHTAGFLVHPNGRAHGPKRSTTTNPNVLLRMHLDGASLREIGALTGIQSDTIRRRLISTGQYAPQATGMSTRAQWVHHLKPRQRVLRAIELEQRGLSLGQISIRLQTPRSTIQDWLRKYHTKHYLWQHQPIPDWWNEAA